MPWGVAIAAVGTYAASRSSNRAAQRGADAAAGASAEATAEQRRQYDQTRQDNLPFLEAGYDAVGRQRRLLAGDYSDLENSPDYLWTRQQGLQSVDRSAAAKGGLYSGGADADRMAYASGLASQNINNYWNRLAGMAGQGQTTASNLGQFGANAANQIGANSRAAGDARASAYSQQGQNNAQLYQSLAGLANNVGQSQGWWGRG